MQIGCEPDTAEHRKRERYERAQHDGFQLVFQRTDKHIQRYYYSISRRNYKKIK